MASAMQDKLQILEKEDLYDRISWYYSEEYSYRKKHRKHG